MGGMTGAGVLFIQMPSDIRHREKERDRVNECTSTGVSMYVSE